MLIAHLPAGYLLTRRLFPADKRVMVAGLLGSVLPDFDAFYFYLVDSSRGHHDYWSHTPFHWLLIAGLVLSVRRSQPLLALFAGVFLHLILDSFAAGIRWLYPLSTEQFGLIQVPARYAWWPLNFIFHWTFLAELTLVALAARARFRPRIMRP